ncbi:MAG: VOC family protein [Bacteroidetes bacterium]|nr:VOC family protein [Bacteroidota bacterium]
MLNTIHPKLPMRDENLTRYFYINKLGFKEFGIADFEGYLMVEKDNVQIHFFEFATLDPKENYGQVYIRTDNIDRFFAFAKESGVATTKLETKPWGQKEFCMLDPDNNLLTIGQTA